MSNSEPMLDKLERDAIISVLHDCNHNITKAAKLLGISARILQRKRKKYGLPSLSSDPFVRQGQIARLMKDNPNE